MLRKIDARAVAAGWASSSIAMGSRSRSISNIRCSSSCRISFFLELSSYSKTVDSNGIEALPALLTNKQPSASTWGSVLSWGQLGIEGCLKVQKWGEPAWYHRSRIRSALSFVRVISQFLMPSTTLYSQISSRENGFWRYAENLQATLSVATLKKRPLFFESFSRVVSDGSRAGRVWRISPRHHKMTTIAARIVWGHRVHLANHWPEQSSLFRGRRSSAFSRI